MRIEIKRDTKLFERGGLDRMSIDFAAKRFYMNNVYDFSKGKEIGG